MFGLGPAEIVIIAVLVLLFFGAKRLPEIGKGLGGAVRELKKVGKDSKPPEKKTAPKEGDKPDQDEEDAPSLEAQVAGKVLEQVPGVRKAMQVKKTADRIKKLVK